MNKNIGIQNLSEIQEVFPKGFLVYGSALGAIREKDIISHDLDTDFGIFSEDFNWAGITELIRRGFRLLSVFGMRHHGMEVSLARDGIKTDLMIFYRKENKVFNCLWLNGGRNNLQDELRHEYDSSLFEKMEIGYLMNTPFNVLGIPYLIAVYGEEWKTPIKEFSWKTDHKCIKK